VGPFVPEFEGEMTFESLPDDFVDRIRQRIETGLLCPGMRSRADYRATSSDRDAIRFEAHGFLTAYNVGLNDVTLRRSGRSQVHYHVTYWRWTWYAVANSLLPAITLALANAFFPAVRPAFSNAPGGLPSLLAILAFFSLVWPWLLTALHRRFAEQALQRILRETLEKGSARAA
jgi:hypothetical protein